MKLPIPFLNNKNTDSDYYLALLLTEDKASAVILKESETVLKTISTHEEFFPHSIEDITLENFIDVIDKTISRAEEVLPPQIETHKTVFGVKDKWVDKDTKKIKKSYLDRLKKVCDALDLQPIGFMVTTEAVTHLIQDEEGAPLSTVLAEIGEKQIALSLLRGGKVVETISSTLMHSAPHTVDKLLSHFTVPVLPARIVLYLTKPDEEASQAFTKHEWSKSLPFLHVPQVTVLPTGYDMRAVMYGAATQMGFTVSETHHKALPKLTQAEKKEEEAIADEVVAEEVAKEPEELTEPEDLNKEEEADEVHTEPKMDNIAPVPDEASGDFGFVVDGDAEDKKLHKDEMDEDIHVRHDEDDEDEEDRPSKRHGKSPLAFLSNLLAVSLPKNLKMPKISSLKGGNAPLKIIIPLIIVIILFVGTYFFYVNAVKATILLTIKPNVVSDETNVTFSADAADNFDNNVITGRNVTTSIPAQVSTTATGKKDVGDKAKGSVTIYNNDDTPANLSAGTQIKASTGQVFVLDKDTKVAAASGDIFTGTKPGTTDASVTANDLGTDGNLPSGTRFTIGSSGSLAARNDSAFSGGTKKNVTVVAKADLDKLKSDALKSVQDAQSKIQSAGNSGETVLPVISDPTLDSVKYDKKEGDEASKVTLTANVVYMGMAYSNDELKNYAQEEFKKKHTDNTNIAPDSVKATVSNANMKNSKTVTASVSLEGGLLPQIDTQDVINNVQDKSLGKAKETIANLPQVADTDIKFSPPIFLIQNLIPRLPKQIAVEIKTE